MQDTAPLMVGVSGLRGISGRSLTPEVASRFASAFAAWLVSRAGNPARRPRVVLGRDGRPGGAAVRDAAASGLAWAGCDVIDAGVAMTPTIGVMADAAKAAGGMVITASHNPQQWNGLKCLVRDAGPARSARAPDKPAADEIAARFRDGPRALADWSGVGVSAPASRDHSDAHARLVFALADRLGSLAAIRRARLSVALDSVNGAGAVFTPAFLGALGCRVTAMGRDIGRPFPHAPEPTAENLGAFARSVKRAGAAVGFAQDPDADRLAIVDDRGLFIGEEWTLVLAARALFELGGARRGSAVAVNMSTSRMIDDLALRHGARVIRTPVGEANVVSSMREHRCVLGGEGNGGVIVPGVVCVRDSLSAMALVLALVARTGRPVSSLVAEMPAYSIVKRKMDLARQSDAAPVAERIAAAFPSARIDRADGVRIDLDQSWLHVRASNTEPILRLIAEAPTAAAAGRILDAAQSAMAGA